MRLSFDLNFIIKIFKLIKLPRAAYHANKILPGDRIADYGHFQWDTKLYFFFKFLNITLRTHHYTFYTLFFLLSCYEILKSVFYNSIE